MSAEIELARLEATVLQSGAVADFLALIDELRRILGTGDDAIVRARLLSLVAPSIGPDLTAAISSAYSAGVNDAVSIIDEGRPRLARNDPPNALAERAVLAARSIADDVERARRLAFAGADLETAFAPAAAASNTLNRAVTSLVNNAGNAGSTAVADAAGYATVWVAETNACVHCLAYSGRVAQPGKSFPGGLTYGPKSYFPDALPHPPLHPHCLPADALVTPGSRITGASARVYDGEMIRIKTLGKLELTGTPNHPVLTRRGWVGLGDLVPGDEVVSRGGAQRSIRRNDDDEHMPALIGELAHTTLRSLEMAAREVPVSAVDFHGDGGGSEVSVVATDSLLRHDLDATLCEHHREALLRTASERGVSLTGEGGANELLLRLGGATDSGMSGFAPSKALLGGGLSHSLAHRGGAATDRDPILLEAAANNGSGDAEAIRDAEFALAGEVLFDEVIDVERFAFHGEVFNLETVGGWYIANGIVTHNCRCTVEPLRAQEFADALRREADRSVLRGFSLESESMKVRIDAARRLLADPNLVAPKSVIDFARRAVRNGAFPTRGRP